MAGSGRRTWVDQQAAVLRAELSSLGLTMSEDDARAVIRERREHVARQMRITPRSAQHYIDDDATRTLAHELAFTLADEQPGADLMTAPRTSQLSLQQVARLTTALAEAVQSWLRSSSDTTQVLDMLSCLSLLGIFTSERVTVDLGTHQDGRPIVTVPPALLTRVARSLQASAQHVREHRSEGADAARTEALAKAFEQDAATLRQLTTP